MKNFLVIGDLHGETDPISLIDQLAASAGIDTIIQVGDLGLFFKNPCNVIEYFESTKDLVSLWITCLGNHDNWDKVKAFVQDSQALTAIAPRLFVAPRNCFYDNCLFLGGAVSVDCLPGIAWHGGKWPGRVEGIDWWQDEAPSLEEFEEFLELLETQKPDYVFTHDGPISLAGGRNNPFSNLPINFVSHQLRTIRKLSTHKPKQWFYGHHHNIDTAFDESYRCCGLAGQGWFVGKEIISIWPTSFNLEELVKRIKANWEKE